MIALIKKMFTSFETSRFRQSFDTRKSFLAAMKWILDQSKVEFLLKVSISSMHGGTLEFICPRRSGKYRPDRVKNFI